MTKHTREVLLLAQLRSFLKYFGSSQLPLSNMIIDMQLLFSFRRTLYRPFSLRRMLSIRQCSSGEVAHSARVHTSNDALMFFLGTDFKQKYTTFYPLHTCKKGAHPPPLTLAHAHFSACYRFHLPHAHGFDAKRGLRFYLVLFL